MSCSGFENKKQTIDDVCRSLGYPEISDTAHKILDDSYQKNVHNGRNKNVVIASSVLVSTRVEEIPVSVDELSDHIGVEKTHTLSAYRDILDSCDIPSADPVSWKVFLRRIVDEIDVRRDIVDRAYEIGKSGEDVVLSGRKPQAYAASALYASCSVEDRPTGVTQKKVSDTVNISVSTIRKTYKELIQRYNND